MLVTTNVQLLKWKMNNYRIIKLVAMTYSLLRPYSCHLWLKISALVINVFGNVRVCMHARVYTYIHTQIHAHTQNDIIKGQGSVKKLSEVGFEPTPIRVDCNLNAAP